MIRLCALYVFRGRSLWGIFRVKGNGIAFVELAQLHVHKRVPVEKQVFREALRGDETETLISDLFDYTFHLVFKLVAKYTSSKI